MADVKFGTDQLGSPAPIGWRRFERVFIMALIPAMLLLVHEWGGINDVLSHRLDLLIGFSGSLVKGIGMFLGNGQEYADKTN